MRDKKENNQKVSGVTSLMATQLPLGEIEKCTLKHIPDAIISKNTEQLAAFRILYSLRKEAIWIAQA
jgi:hypothetical protein